MVDVRGLSLNGQSYSFGMLLGSMQLVGNNYQEKVAPIRFLVSGERSA